MEIVSRTMETCGNGVKLLLQAWDADDPSKSVSMSSSLHHLLSPPALAWIHQVAVVHNQLQAKDDCWRIDALYKLQPNKVHSKKMQYMKVHHGEVHHKEVHHEEVQLKLQRAQKMRSLGKDDCWHIIEALYKLHPCSTIRCSTQR